jgi:hypothetical protein
VHFIERGNEILFQPITKKYIHSVCGMLKHTPSATDELMVERKKDQEREEIKRQRIGAP